MSFRSLSLLQAVTSRDAGAVKALLSEGADVNARNDSGQTPLILAIVSGQDHLLRLLLEAGANPLLRDHTQLNAVDWAERKGRSDLTQVLARTTQLPTPSTRNLNEKLDEAEKKTPPSLDELRPVRSLSSDEKTRNWLAGIKQRLDEKAAREATKKPQSVSGESNQSNTVRSGRTLPVNSEEVTPEINKAPLLTHDATPEISLQTTARISPATAHGVPLASTPPNKPSSSRKRCPECNTFYNSELLAYCSYHVVPLVDADEPIVAPKIKRPSAVLWTLVLITLSLAVFAGVFLSSYLYKNNNRLDSSAPAVTMTRQGTPVLGSTLVGKEVKLPAAEITPRTLEQTVTITVSVRIDQGGRVVSASSTEGDRLLRDAAIEAAKRSTFAVEKSRGRGAEGTITYTFSR